MVRCQEYCFHTWKANSSIAIKTHLIAAEFYACHDFESIILQGLNFRKTCSYLLEMPFIDKKILKSQNAMVNKR